MIIRDMTKEQLAEESMIDIAYAVLAEKKENLTLRQLMDEVRKLNGVTVKAMAEKLHRVNTDINIDGRFLSIDDIRWGLREWYPVDQLEVESAPVVRTRRKRRKTADDLDDLDEDEDYVDDDGFDKIDLEEDDDEEDDDVVEGEIEVIDPELLVEEDADVIDEDLLEEDEVLPDDVVFDDDEEDDEDEELEDEE